MADNEEHTIVGDVKIKVNGSPLDAAVDAQLMEVVVDQSLHMPSMFTILIDDPDMTVIDGDTFAFADEVEILAVNEDNSTVSLIKGEITGLEPTFASGGQLNSFLVRGYDNSHKLHRQSKTKAWLNKSDSQIAKAIAGEAKLSAEVESTSTTYKHVFQDNQSDMEFLQGRAWRIGFECFVADGKLYFRKPATSGESVTLTANENLMSFSPRARVSEQVTNVTVKGWDPVQKKAIQGMADGTGDYQPSISLAKGDEAAGEYFKTAKLVIVDQPLENQSEGNDLAKARLNERSGAFIHAEGVAYRTPSIKAGGKVTIEGIGTKFSGDYKVTSATHIFNMEGWTTHFEVSGLRSTLLSESMNHNRPLNRWPGVVTAIVDDVKDPEKMGRVLVRYPWMDDSQRSCWARVMGIGAGPEAGYFVIPQVKDEVVVAFEFGDINRPVLIGGLWNGKDKPPPMVKHDKDSPKIRTWTSTIGHQITMYDKSGEEKIEIKTKAGHLVVMDDADEQIQIESKGGHKIIIDDKASKITVNSKGDVEVKASANAKVEAMGNMDLKATGNLKVNGSMVDIQATGAVNIKGTTINLG